MGGGNATIQRGGGLPVVGGGGSVMTHTACSVTTQSIAFKYVMASEPYRNTWYLKQRMAGLPYIKIYFFKNTYSIEIKMFLKLIWIALDLGENFRKVCKKLDLSSKKYFTILFFKVSAWLSNQAVCKIGLRSQEDRSHAEVNLQQWINGTPYMDLLKGGFLAFLTETRFRSQEVTKM